MNRILSFASVITLSLSAGLVSCSKQTAENPTAHTQQSPSAQDVALLDTATTAPVEKPLVLSGRVATNSNTSALVYPQVGGVVQEVRVGLGDKVTKGQVLAVIKSSAIVELQHQHSASQTDLDIARKNLQVAESMFADGLASERDVTLARKELQKAQSGSTKFSKQMTVYGVSKDGLYTLRAPISGFITEKNVTDHMQFNLGNVTSLFTVSNLDEVWVMANVFEADIAKVQEGQQVMVSTLAYPNQQFTGRIDQVSHMLDPESKVMKVRVRLANPGYMLKPGMYTEVTVPLHEQEFAMVRQQATDATVVLN
ncbi:efflux RND transporter periplasmic adaptor subunit [Hymenobacter jejuensis]|uniref:Efflux RND transporter periplasmic adaptor subunit n=1 Tax=Hymenobacter jejuensis TaxID=2502781 RepID=A0A5B7ZUL2_9BACT|nr:efflux RND transporter periplasmic adaptor subunit [Hymenobacter jejuensis]QDA58658.1 efflux RND transporter periplasmic adaptor subunit [Hymenobacter jejuensis]